MAKTDEKFDLARLIFREDAPERRLLSFFGPHALHLLDAGSDVELYVPRDEEIWKKEVADLFKDSHAFSRIVGFARTSGPDYGGTAFVKPRVWSTDEEVFRRSVHELFHFILWRWKREQDGGYERALSFLPAEAVSWVRPSIEKLFPNQKERVETDAKDEALIRLIESRWEPVKPTGYGEGEWGWKAPLSLIRYLEKQGILGFHDAIQPGDEPDPDAYLDLEPHREFERDLSYPKQERWERLAQAGEDWPVAAMQEMGGMEVAGQPKEDSRNWTDEQWKQYFDKRGYGKSKGQVAPPQVTPPPNTAPIPPKKAPPSPGKPRRDYLPELHTQEQMVEELQRQLKDAEEREYTLKTAIQEGLDRIDEKQKIIEEYEKRYGPVKLEEEKKPEDSATDDWGDEMESPPPGSRSLPWHEQPTEHQVDQILSILTGEHSIGQNKKAYFDEKYHRLGSILKTAQEAAQEMREGKIPTFPVYSYPEIR